eukprot:3019512-Prymnesium_polylepis.4
MTELSAAGSSGCKSAAPRAAPCPPCTMNRPHRAVPCCAVPPSPMFRAQRLLRFDALTLNAIRN